MSSRSGLFATLLIGMFSALGCASVASPEASPDTGVFTDAARADISPTSDSGAMPDSVSIDLPSSVDGPADDSIPAPDTTTFDAPGTDAVSDDVAILSDTPTVTDAGCSTGATQSCATSCGSTGTETCSAGIWGACVPPREVCNLADDDCSGHCDDVLGCRIGVDRSYNGTAGLHFYTTTDSEAVCCGYAVEGWDYFYLYDQAQPGLAPLYRCRTASSAHLLSIDPACDGAIMEGRMGYIATSPVCGSIPLYGLHSAGSGDYLYTTSMAEAASAASGGYTMEGTLGYVWSSDCGGASCTWPSPIELSGSTTTAATGFPTVWYGYPIEAGAQSVRSLSGSVTIDNSANLYSEVLFILEYLPTGACTSGRWPASTPEYGPPGAQSLGQFIVKSPTAGSVGVSIDLTLPGGLPISGCVLLGLNGGTVTTPHDVTAAADLTLTYSPSTPPAQSLIGMGGEFCFGQNWGCQGATTNNALAFASVTPITRATSLVALYGDISDSTFDGTSAFGAAPSGAWTAINDFYVYHGAECSAFGVASGTAGPGNYLASVPADATHLLSVPLSGSGIGVSQMQVYQAFTGVDLVAGDCLVTLWGMHGNGGFDNETQVFALVSP